jgi:hypothetical protein
MYLPAKAMNNPGHYPVQNAALHLTTSDEEPCAILFRLRKHPIVLANPHVYNTRMVTTASSTDDDNATVLLRRTNLRPDLAFLALDAEDIALTPLYLKFTWTNDVTIANIPNVRSLTFHFELHPPRMGSDMVQRTRFLPPRLMIRTRMHVMTRFGPRIGRNTPAAPVQDDNEPVGTD